MGGWGNSKVKNMSTPNLLFLPGASGSTEFWQPVLGLMPADYRCTVQAYPGFGNETVLPSVNSMAELSDWVIEQLNQPTVLVAQSMGGIIAIQAALRKPDCVQALVLVATSGGLDVLTYGAADWRTDYMLEMKHLPQWFVETQYDFSPDFSRIHQPVLLLWGDADPISPVAVGKALQAQLPDARLEIIHNGGHDFAYQYAAQVASQIERFISSFSLKRPSETF